jgi:DNA-directed RNA polymerase sigma subunit (sigma70/sigma32)
MSTVVVKSNKPKVTTTNNIITNVIQNKNIERNKNYMNNNENQNNRNDKNSYDNDDETYKHNQAKYLISPSTPRHEISAKFTASNKKYLDVGLKLRSQYTKLKLLTADEEIIAAKFSQVGKKLDMIKKYMENKLKRDITTEEWAKACKLNIAQLSMYRDMAHSARNKLVQHNIRLVDFWTIRLIEHSKNAKQISYYELLSEGIIGLRKAADLYDGSTRFIKYAKVFILSELYRGMTTLRPGM